MTHVEPSPPPDPSAPGRGLSRRARGAIIVVVLGGLLLVGAIVSSRRRDDYDHAMTRVQVEAGATGTTIDLDAFKSAWAQQQVSQETSLTDGPLAGMIPELDGAKAVNVDMIWTPPQAIIDYQVEAGGQDGCVRAIHSASGTTVRVAHDVCAKSFLGDP
ncbi:MAG: hypothetical protein ACXWCM_14325 [Acidimicrobiales bacterium]